MQRFGVTIPFDGTPLHAQEDLFKELEGLGYTDLWSSEANAIDGFTPLVLASQWAPSVRLGCAIFPAYTRGPATLAMSVAGICQAAPGRFTMGIGSSSDRIVQDFNDIPLEKPYQRVRDVTRFLRIALAGEKVSEEFESFKIKGFRLGAKVDPQPPILIAALRQGMLELAGRVGDGAILNWLSAEDVKTVVPFVKKGGADKEIVARIFVAPNPDREQVRNMARFAISSYASVPVYSAFHAWLGRGEQLAESMRLWGEGDRRGSTAAVPDEVVDSLIVHGTPEECRNHIQRYVDNGDETPVLAILPLGIDPVQAARDLAPR
jgi:probable F420-dependent oxidoreductase